MPVSIVSCNLDRKLPDLAIVSTDKANGASGKYRLRYEIMMATSAVSGPINVLSQALTGSPHPLPSLWATYSYQGDTDTHSFAKSFLVERDPQVSARFYVTVNYEPAEPGELPNGGAVAVSGGTPIKAEPNPLLRQTLFWWDREVTSKIHSTDKDGAVIKNYANNLYDELVEFDRARSVLVAEFNVATLANFLDLSQGFDQKVNTAAWVFSGRTFPPRTVLVREVSSSPNISEGAYNFYRVTMRLMFAEKGDNPSQPLTWDTPIPEMSATHFSKDGSDYEMDGTFYKRTSPGFPIPLNEDGTRRTDDQPILVKDWKVRREADFNLLTPLQVI